MHHSSYVFNMILIKVSVFVYMLSYGTSSLSSIDPHVIVMIFSLLFVYVGTSEWMASYLQTSAKRARAGILDFQHE